MVPRAVRDRPGQRESCREPWKRMQTTEAGRPGQQHVAPRSRVRRSAVGAQPSDSVRAIPSLMRATPSVILRVTNSMPRSGLSRFMRLVPEGAGSASGARWRGNPPGRAG